MTPPTSPPSDRPHDRPPRPVGPGHRRSDRRHGARTGRRSAMRRTTTDRPSARHGRTGRDPRRHEHHGSGDHRSAPASNRSGPTRLATVRECADDLGDGPVASKPPSAPSLGRNRNSGVTTGSPRCVPSTAAISHTTRRPPRMLGDLRRVEGVAVSGPDGRYDLKAKAVIACAGGFQANPEMRARYLAGNTDMMKVRGSRHDTGEVLRMLLDLGARPAGHWQSGHMSPIDAQCARTSRRRSTRTAAATPRAATTILSASRVNALGLRFFDEGEAQHSYTYAKTGRAVLAQPGARRLPDLRSEGHHAASAIRTIQATFVEADTIAELARRSGSSRRCWSHTVEEFNARVPRRHRLRSAPAGRQGHARARDPEIELGDPHRRAAVSRLSGHRRHHLHFGGVEVEPQRAGAEHDATSRSRGCSPPAISSGCSSTTTRRSPGRPATRCSDGSPATRRWRRDSGFIAPPRGARGRPPRCDRGAGRWRFAARRHRAGRARA